MAKRRLSKADRLNAYRKRVDWSRKWREDEGYDALWRRLVDLYRGKHFVASTDEDRIAINIAFSTLNVIYPSVSINHPKVTVTAETPDNDDRAAIVEAVVNYWWRHHDFKSPFRRAVKDSLTIGHGWLKVGYRYVEEDVELSDDEFYEALDQQVGEADAFAEQNPEMAASLPTDEDIAANLPTTKSVVKEDRPFVDRVSPKDIYVDPEATCMADLNWIAQKIVRELDDVRSDKKYKPGVRAKVSPDSTYYSDDYRRDSKKETDADRVTVWEFYDIARGTMCVWADQSDDYLIDPVAMPYKFGHPFVFIGNYDVPDEFYPMGDLEQLEDLQGELNKTRSEMMNRRNKDKRKHLYRESAFGPEGRQALESDEDNVLVPVIDEDRPFSDLVAPMPQTDLNAQDYSWSELIENDLDRVSGVNEYARGSIPEIKRTATEAAMIQDAANARAADKLDRIEEVLGLVAKRVVQIAQQFLTGEQMARITKGDKNLWIPFTHADIVGEFDFSVEGGSTQPMNETGRRQQATAFMQAMGPFIGSVVDPQKVAVHVMRNGFGIKNPEDFILPPAEPVDEQQERFQLTMNYRDAPPDIRRQMEEDAGYQRSQLGDIMPGAAGTQMGMRETGTNEGPGPEGPPMPPPRGPGGPGPASGPDGAGGTPPPMAGGLAPGDMPQGGAGMDAPQLDPLQLVQLQQGDPADGIPPELLAQLREQIGLNL
jgi:hypothetical protein